MTLRVPAAFALMVAFASSAQATQDSMIDRALAMVAAGKSAEAYALLRPQRDARADDIDYDYALGLAAVDSGRRVEAILAFQRVLALNPKQASARAELARAYALTGDIDTARREFDTVAGDPSVPDPVRQRFDSVVHTLDRTLRPGASVTGYVSAGGGYDSNVNAATSAAQVVIPLFAFLGPATLSGNARAASDAFGTAEGGVSLNYGFDRQSRVFASVLGMGRYYGRQTSLNQLLGTATLGYAYTAADHNVASLSLQTQQFVLGGDHYRSAFGIIGQYTFALRQGRALTLQAQAFDIRYPNDRFRNARRYSVGAGYATRTFSISLQGGHEQTRDPAADNLSNSYGGTRIAFELPVAKRVAIFGAAAVELRRYDAPDPLFLTTRRDTQYDASLGLRIGIAPRLSIDPQVGYTRNQSNIAINDYDRFTAFATLRLDF